MSTKKILFSNIKCESNLTEKEILKKNIQPRISEINHKIDKTLFIDNPKSISDKVDGVNPFYKTTIKKLFCINSKFRIDYCSTTSSNFLVDLYYPLKNVISMRLVSIQIPQSWYNISAKLGNNIFFVRINSGSWTSFKIDDGNYDPFLLRDVINRLLSTGLFSNLKIAYNQLTNKFSFYIDDVLSTDTYDISFDLSTCADGCKYKNTLGWIMGFRNKIYNGLKGSLKNMITGEGLYDNGSNRYIYVVVDDFNKNVNDHIIVNLDKSYLNKNILSKVVYQTVRSNGLESATNYSATYWPINQTKPETDAIRIGTPSIVSQVPKITNIVDQFDMNVSSPYMLLVATLKKGLCKKMSSNEERLFGIDKLNIPRSTLPAITHVDYSARIQTVTKDSNKIYFELLTKFKERTKCPVLVNTSFNIRGEPIVNSPEDAFRCFMGTDLDCLVIGNAYLNKQKQDNNLKTNYTEKFELD